MTHSIEMDGGIETGDIILHLGFGKTLTLKAIAEMFILGCSWGLGFFLMEGVVDPIRPVIAYSFTIINVFQGVYIYLVCCLLNHKVSQPARLLGSPLKLLDCLLKVSSLGSPHFLGRGCVVIVLGGTTFQDLNLHCSSRNWIDQYKVHSN